MVLSYKGLIKILALFLTGCILFITLPPSLYHDLLEDHTLEQDFGCITHHAEMGTHFDEKNKVCLLSDKVYEIQTLVFLLILVFKPLVQFRRFTLSSDNLIVELILSNNGRAPPFI